MTHGESKPRANRRHVEPLRATERSRPRELPMFAAPIEGARSATLWLAHGVEGSEWRSPLSDILDLMKSILDRSRGSPGFASVSTRRRTGDERRRNLFEVQRRQLRCDLIESASCAGARPVACDSLGAPCDGPAREVRVRASCLGLLSLVPSQPSFRRCC